jgi:hypothetical protein
MEFIQDSFELNVVIDKRAVEPEREEVAATALAPGQPGFGAPGAFQPVPGAFNAPPRAGGGGAASRRERDDDEPTGFGGAFGGGQFGTTGQFVGQNGQPLTNLTNTMALRAMV